MKILVSYRGIPQSPGWATGDMVVQALKQLGHDVYPYAKYYQQNRWVEGRPPLDKHIWDLLIFLECNDGDPQYPELRLVSARKTACWLFDTSYHADSYRTLVDYFGFDYLFLANPITVRQYKVLNYQNVHYLPYACDSHLHGRSLDFPKTRDAVLVGSIRNDRIQLVNECRKRGLNVELIGDLYRKEYIDALASARVIINQNPIEGYGLMNMRWFESVAAGAFVIGEERDLNLNIQEGFNKPTNMLSYPLGNYEHLISTVRNLLNNDRPQSQEDFFINHTYVNRCQQIISTIFSNEGI